MADQMLDREQAIDQERAGAFMGEVVGVLNGAMLALQTSIGHRTGLFDHMAPMAPATSEEIAGTAGLEERYVREWLGAMVTGGVVEYDPDDETFHLPAEHAACLTRAAGPDNLASMARFVGLLSGVEDQVIECFRSGGGVPYSAYPTFQELMAAESAQVHDAMLVDVIIPLAEELPGRLEEGIDVLDVGCGRGHAVNLLAQAFPNSTFTGWDISEEGVAVAREEAAELGLTNAHFEVQDVVTLGDEQRFDLVTAFDAIHDQAHPGRVLRGIQGSLRPGGVFLCVDIAASSDLADNVEHPLGPFFYTVSTMHCMTVSLARDGDGLGTMWGEQQALELIEAAGFDDVSVHHIEGDMVNSYYLARKR